MIMGKSVNLLARVMAMGKMHKTFAITAGIPAAIGAVIPDSVVNRVVAKGEPLPPDGEIVIGHPSGMMDGNQEIFFSSLPSEVTIALLRWWQ